MMQSLTTRTVAFGGVMLALSTATLFLASFIPGIELTLYAISSLYAAVMILMTNIRGGSLFYIASGILSLILIPDKAAVLPYLFFFGNYGIIKYLVEKIKKQPVEILLKLLFFNISVGSGILLFRAMFLDNFQLPDYSGYLLIAGGQLLFLLYDYIFTLLIAFCKRRFPKQH